MTIEKHDIECNRKEVGIEKKEQEEKTRKERNASVL